MKISANQIVRRLTVPTAALLVSVLAFAPSATAQLARAGGPTLLGTLTQIAAPAIKGVDTAYDPVNNVYLVINAYIPSVAWFVNTSGTPVTGFFDIARGGGGFHFPRARYSPQIGQSGGFLITYLEESGGAGNMVHARTLTYPGVLGPDNIISDKGSPTWIESAAAVGYSPTSQRFLVAWRTYPTLPYPVHLAARLVDISGAGVGTVLSLSSGFGRDPGVAWNSRTDEFGVSFTAENSSGSAGYNAFAVVSPSTGAFTRQSFNSISGFTFITDVDYNPDTGRYVMTWHQQPGGVPEVRAAEIDAAGLVVSSGMVSREMPGYDALSLAFNPISRTFLLTSIRPSGTSDEIVGAELNSRGVRTSAVTSIVPPTVVPGILGRYPRVAANTEAPQWDIVYSDRLKSVNNVVVSTTSTNGGPASEPTTVTSGGGSTGTSCTTAQPGPGWTCVNGGWLPPTTSTGGSTGSCTTAQPGANWTCVNGSWLPPTTSTGGSTGSCTTAQPGSNWTCVNGNWLPGTSSGSSCTTVQPGPGWTCVNGNWLPGTSSGSSCTTVQPGPNWTCVNGNWLPGTSSGSSCTTPQPGSNWTCVNGNWLPGTSSGSSCTTPQPGSNWSCVNGSWLPATMLVGSTDSCTTSQPGPGWTCVAGDWKAPSAP